MNHRHEDIDQTVMSLQQQVYQDRARIAQLEKSVQELRDIMMKMNDATKDLAKVVEHGFDPRYY